MHILITASVSTNTFLFSAVSARRQPEESPTLTLSRERSQSAGSNNSIEGEFNHFRPILSAPRSPPKKLADGSLMEPRLLKPNQCKHLFGAGNISEFLKKQQVETSTGERRVLEPPAPISELKIDEPVEELSQSLLARDNRDDAREDASTRLLTHSPSASDPDLARDPSTPSMGSAAAEDSSADIDTQSLLSLLDQGRPLKCIPGLVCLFTISIPSLELNGQDKRND